MNCVLNSDFFSLSKTEFTILINENVFLKHALKFFQNALNAWTQ